MTCKGHRVFENYNLSNKEMVWRGLLLYVGPMSLPSSLSSLLLSVPPSVLSSFYRFPSPPPSPFPPRPLQNFLRLQLPLPPLLLLLPPTGISFVACFAP